MLAYYLVSQIILLANYENNFQRQAWSNDVITKPSDIPITNSNFKIAVKLYLLADGMDHVDINQYFRFQFN